MLFVLPALLGTALIAWGFDMFDHDDGNDQNSGQDQGSDQDNNNDVTVENIDSPPYDAEVRGTSGNDTYVSAQTQNMSERMFMGKGDDWVEGKTGFDALNLGEGNDVGIAGDGKDHLFGGEGDDLLSGGRWNDYISGGEGSDVVVSQKSLDSFSQFIGDTTLKDSLTGETAPRADTVNKFLSNSETSDSGNDLIEGGAGNDLLMDSEGRDWIYGGAGDDLMASLDDANTDAADNLRGGAGEDVLAGDDGDTLHGGGDKDTFWVDVQNDRDQAVTIKDWEPNLQEKVIFELHSSDSNYAPRLDYEIQNDVATLKIGNQTLASIKTADGSAITAEQIQALVKYRVVA